MDSSGFLKDSYGFLKDSKGVVFFLGFFGFFGFSGRLFLVVRWRLESRAPANPQGFLKDPEEFLRNP